MLTKQADIEVLMRRELNEAEAAVLPHLDDEARFLIQGFTSEEYDENFPMDIPREVVTVANRLIVRALRSNPDVEGVSSVNRTTGPFSRQVTYTEGGSDRMYLGKAEKEMLKRRLKNFTVVNLGNY